MAYDEYTGAATHVIRYRYTCVNCGKTTDWTEYTLRVGYAVRARGTYNADVVKKAERAAMDKKIAHVKKSIAKGHLFESSFMARVEDFYDLDRKCPFCGTKQPNKGVKVEYDWNGR